MRRAKYGEHTIDPDPKPGHSGYCTVCGFDWSCWDEDDDSEAKAPPCPEPEGWDGYNDVT